MTATVSGPARTWAGAHRMLIAVVAFAIALAAAATVAIPLVTSTTSSPARTTSTVPVEQEELTDTQKACEAARVVGC